jgi:hypothetical protein
MFAVALRQPALIIHNVGRTTDGYGWHSRHHEGESAMDEYDREKIDEIVLVLLSLILHYARARA